jgi:ribonuclease HIII
VNSLQESARRLIFNHKELLRKTGLIVSEPELKQFSFEIDIKRGKNKAKVLVYFGKKGIKTIVQGDKNSRLFKEINEFFFGKELFDSKPEELDEPDNYIGIDESGKGDYFGPLVIAGVYLDSQSKDRLKGIGVRDSKLLSDQSIHKIASEIRNAVSGKYDIIPINPEKYNQLYLKIKNVNKLLGWGHARVIENILGKVNATVAISDKFGDESIIRNSLQSKGKNITLHQRTKAERYTAVAAASILARDKFAEWFIQQEKEFKLYLPKGSSKIVEDSAKEIKKKYGDEFLEKLVKLHFKTTKKIITI